MLVLQRCQPHGQHLCSLSNTSRTKNASPHWPTITINIRSANFKASATTTGEDTERGGGGKTTEIDQIYHTTCSPPYHQHYNKDVILQSWSQESSGLFTTSERKREITRCVCIVGQTLCFSFCRASLAGPDRLISSGIGPLHRTLAFKLALLEESLHHCLWHREPHDTIRGQAERHLS